MDATDVESQVHIGTWTNWSRGPIMGRTLTLSRSHGNLLIAFTASFIAFVSARFWRIICVTLHRSYSTSLPSSALYHQRQVLLRNSPSPEAGLWSLITLCFAWRGTTLRWLLCLGPALFLSAFTIAAFISAGGFSSTIASAVGDVVLLRANNCGRPGGISDDAAFTAYISNYAEHGDTAANYAQQCYFTSQSLFDCTRFVQDHLSWQTDNNASCPFSSELCRKDWGNLRLDTGQIHLNSGLGLNVPAKDALAIRTVLHCAPLVTEGFTTHVPTTNGTMVKYHYGHSIAPAIVNLTSPDFAHQVQDIDIQYEYVLHRPDMSARPSNFQLVPIGSLTVNGEPSKDIASFIPLPELVRSDGDVTLVFLSGNGVLAYRSPIDDDWYRMTSPSPIVVANSIIEGNTTTYLPEEAASPLGCVEQFQYCNLALPSEIGCGPLASRVDAYVQAAPLFNTTAQPSDLDETEISDGNESQLFWVSSIWGGALDLFYLLKMREAKALASQKLLFDGAQYPADHETPLWQIDVANWFATVLASLQTKFVDTILGPNREALSDSWIPAYGKVQESLCNSQKIKSTKFTSFSLFGLCFTYICGSAIILISFTLEPALHLLHKRYNFQPYQEVEWITNNSLQLHRLAQEELGHGEWIKCDHEIPITTEDTSLGTLNLDDCDHPVINKPLDAYQDEEPRPEETYANIQDDDQREPKRSESSVSLEDVDQSEVTNPAHNNVNLQNSLQGVVHTLGNSPVSTRVVSHDGGQGTRGHERPQN